ncbi:MAG: hypothetical protein SPL77_05300, partial [Prevotella sp.]|nr:hypothetical protein [Prevotella sp.]
MKTIKNIFLWVTTLAYVIVLVSLVVVLVSLFLVWCGFMKFVAIFAWAAVTAVVSAFVWVVAALIAGVELSEE